MPSKPNTSLHFKIVLKRPFICINRSNLTGPTIKWLLLLYVNIWRIYLPFSVEYGSCGGLFLSIQRFPPMVLFDMAPEAKASPCSSH
jgi:hypothetical protein